MLPWKKHSPQLRVVIDSRQRQSTVSETLLYIYGFNSPIKHFLVGTRYCGDIGFLLDFHRDVDRVCIDTEVTSLYDVSFQHHNDAVAITERNVKLHVIVIPVFNVVLISDKDENAINNGKYVLFHLSKCSGKLLF